MICCKQYPLFKNQLLIFNQMISELIDFNVIPKPAEVSSVVLFEIKGVTKRTAKIPDGFWT